MAENKIEVLQTNLRSKLFAHTSHTFTMNLNANVASNQTIDLVKSGWRALGVSGYNLDGSNATYLSVYCLHVTGSYSAGYKLNCATRNLSHADSTGAKNATGTTIAVEVLWVKVE